MSLSFHDNGGRECASRCVYIAYLEGDEEEGIYPSVFSVIKLFLPSEENRLSSACWRCIEAPTRG
jgi:hypothetical protein